MKCSTSYLIWFPTPSLVVTVLESVQEATPHASYDDLPSNWITGHHRVWLVDGLLIGAIGFLGFAVYVGVVRGEFEQWPRYAIACLLGLIGVASVPTWRGGYAGEVAIASGFPRAFKAWAAVFSLLALLGLLLGEVTGFSRVWFFGWLVLGSLYLVVSRARDLGRGALGQGQLLVRRFFGVDVSAMSADETVHELDRSYQAGHAIKVGFANANTFHLSNQSPSFRRHLKGFLILNDGIGMDIASYLRFGRRFPENLNGTDFMPRYLERTSQCYRMYLLGVAEGAEGFIRGDGRRELHEGFELLEDLGRDLGMLLVDSVWIDIVSRIEEVHILRYEFADPFVGRLPCSVRGQSVLVIYHGPHFRFRPSRIVGPEDSSSRCRQTSPATSSAPATKASRPPQVIFPFARRFP